MLTLYCYSRRQIKRDEYNLLNGWLRSSIILSMSVLEYALQKGRTYTLTAVQSLKKHETYLNIGVIYVSKCAECCRHILRTAGHPVRLQVTR